jgi:hemin uptake protein HemP
MQLRVSRTYYKGVKQPMSQPPRSIRLNEVGGETADLAAPVVDSVTLMGGRRELIIRHGADTYRLRVTASNKLILTK